MDKQILELGILGIALLFIIKELFTYLKTRKNGGNGNVNQQLLDAITAQNDNHLHTMQQTIDSISGNINTGNDRMVDAIKAMHIDLATKLGELKGKLDK